MSDSLTSSAQLNIDIRQLNDSVDPTSKQKYEIYKEKIRTLFQVPPLDLKQYKKHVLMLGNHQWRSTKIISSDPLQIILFYGNSPILSSCRNIITHLRIGHNNLTRSHLFSQLFHSDCQYWHTIQLSVEHIFRYPATQIQCNQLQILSSYSKSLTNSYSSISRVLTHLDVFNISHPIWNKSHLKLNLS